MKFEFAIDLVCSTSPTSIPLEGDSQSGFLSDAVHEQGSSEMVRAGGGGDGEILGSHSITFCNIGAETVMKGTKLLFRDRGLGALHGVSTCTLVDIRYDHHIEPTNIPQPFVAFLFEGVTVALGGARDA